MLGGGLSAGSHQVPPRANPVQYKGSQYDIASDTYTINTGRYSPDLQRYLGVPSSSIASAPSGPIGHNRGAFDRPSGASYAEQRAAENQALAARNARARTLRTSVWEAAVDAFALQAALVFNGQDTNWWTDAEANHYFGAYWGTERHLDPIMAKVIDAAGSGVALDWSDPAIRAYMAAMYQASMMTLGTGFLSGGAQARGLFDIFTGKHCEFWMRGDLPHFSSTIKGQVSVHGWWENVNCPVDVAWVTTYLDVFENGQWVLGVAVNRGLRMPSTKQKKFWVGAGAWCVNSKMHGFRGRTDVDLPKIKDNPDQHISPTSFLECGVS